MMAAAVARPKWQQSPSRCKQEKWLFRRCRILQQESALAEVIQQKRWQYKCEPRKANRTLPEVSHIRVQGFAPGDYQKDRTEHREAVLAGAKIYDYEPTFMRARIACRDLPCVAMRR
jgi:hypothetical protein